jgi:hypothetical protein
MGLLNEHFWSGDKTVMIKYSPLLEIKPEVAQLVFKGVELARKCADMAAEACNPEHDQSHEAKECVAMCLLKHFKIRKTHGLDPQRQVAQNFKKIATYLRDGTLVLKDARIVAIRQAVSSLCEDVGAGHGFKQLLEGYDDDPEMRAIAQSTLLDESIQQMRIYDECLNIQNGVIVNEMMQWLTARQKVSENLLRNPLIQPMLKSRLNNVPKDEEPALGYMRIKRKFIAQVTKQEEEGIRNRIIVESLNRKEIWGHIHLDMTKDPQTHNPLNVAHTIIHEASHKCLFTSDYAYIWESGYGTLSMKQAVMNADCYGIVNASIGCGKFCANHDDVTMQGTRFK